MNSISGPIRLDLALAEDGREIDHCEPLFILHGTIRP